MFTWGKCRLWLQQMLGRRTPERQASGLVIPALICCAGLAIVLVVFNHLGLRISLKAMALASVLHRADVLRASPTVTEIHALNVTRRSL